MGGYLAFAQMRINKMMKQRSLEWLLKMGLNIHDFKVCSTLQDLEDYAKSNSMFTIRFDRCKDIRDLPFYIVENTEQLSRLPEIADLASEMNCTMICSNGKQYDKDQICNFVYERLGDDFILEVSFEKKPLRAMYNENLISIRGKVYDDFKEFKIFGQKRQYVSSGTVNRILEEMSIAVKKSEAQWKDDFRYECTMYPINVGILQSRFIYWQAN